MIDSIFVVVFFSLWAWMFALVLWPESKHQRCLKRIEQLEGELRHMGVFEGWETDTICLGELAGTYPDLRTVLVPRYSELSLPHD